MPLDPATFDRVDRRCNRFQMSDFEYVPVSSAGTVFDVVSDGSTIGMVWIKGDRWHASIVSRADLSICESSREQAAYQLLKRWIELVKG